MKIVGFLIVALAAATVDARHRKEWQRVNPLKVNREVLRPIYKSESPVCSKGVGFYRDPHDCHQFYRCVDEFSNGRRFSVYVGRCEPGLVFDENTTACNWPGLSAPCNNSPEKLRDPTKTFKPKEDKVAQVPQNNDISGQPNKWGKPYPEQVLTGENKPIIQVQEAFQDAEPQQEMLEESQSPSTPEKSPVLAETNVQKIEKPETAIQQQESWNPAEEQTSSQEIQSSLQEVSQDDTQQAFQDTQQPTVQEDIQQVIIPQISPVVSEGVAQISETPQMHDEENKGQEIKQSQEQTSSGSFQQIAESKVTQVQVFNKNENNSESSQQQVQEKWWLPEEESQNAGSSMPNDNVAFVQVPASDTSEEGPIFCQKEGFFRHPEDCNRFVRCIKLGQRAYSVHFFQCPKFLVFDETDSLCINTGPSNCSFSRRSKRQAGVRLECRGEGFFRHPVDCRAFYRCVQQPTGAYETHHFSCPANLVFDEEYATCNWPDKAPPCETRRQAYKPLNNKPLKSTQPPRQTYRQPQKSTYKGSWSTPRPQNDYFDLSITQKPTKDFSKNRYTQQYPKSTSPPSYDGPQCRNPGFYRHNRDCTKFFKCVKRGNYFVRYELSCPQNFGYNERLQRCDEQTSCNKKKRPYPPRQDDEEISSTTEETTAASEKSGESNDDIVCEKEGYFRHPDDCNRFYRCVDFNGDGQEFVRYDFKCPDGLVFDEKNSICNWPDQSPCEGGKGEGGGDDSSSENGSSSSAAPEENTSEDSASEKESSTTAEPVQPTSSTTDDRGDDSASEGDGGAEETSESDDGVGGGSSSEDGCTQEGFFRNPEDCNKFYRCVDFNGDGKEFVRYDFTCPEGLVFDEANSVCNWPSDSAPCEGGTGENDGSSGKESSTQSTQGDQSSSTTAGASDSTATDSSSTTSSTMADSQSSSMPSTDSTTGGDASDSGGGGGSSNDGECTEAGFFRNPEDCNKFYRCVDYNGDGKEFVKYDFKCPEGLVFDESNSVCNWPEQSAPCEGGESGTQTDTSKSDGADSSSTTMQSTTSEQSQTTGSSSDKSTSDSAMESTTSKSESSTTESGSSSGSTETGETSSDGKESTEGQSGSNDGECTEEGFYRNPNDCGKFYRCVDFNGDGQQFVRYDFDCPEGLYFDEVNSVCNWPEQSPKCDTSGKETKSDNKTEESTTESGGEASESTSNGSSDQSTTESSSTTSGGATECKEEGFFRCPEDCTKFYRCKDEKGDGQFTRYDFKCPDGLIFDDKNKKCDWPSSELTCDTDSSSSSTTAATEQTSTTQATTTTTQQSSTTNRPTQSSSTAQATSSGTSSSSGECSEEGFFKNPDDCSKYYRCIDEGDGTFTKEDFSCAEDEVFDEEMRYCNRKDLAPPCEDSTQGQTTTAEGTTSSGKDECREPGFYRCSDDCNKFYRCVDESGDGQNLVRYDFKCPDGLIFDEKNSKCDWPSSELTCDTESSTSSGSTTQSSTTQPPSSDSTSASSGTTSSSGECTEEGFFKNPEDCTKYYRCIDEGDGTFTREDFSCAEDEVFDEEMRYCNRKDLAPPCEDSTQGQTTTAEAQGTSSGKDECKEPGFYRCSDDCNKFYRCVDESGDGQNLVRYDFKCPDGLIFDEKNNKCDWPSSELTCDTESSTSSGSTTQSSTTQPPSSDSTSASSGTTSSSGECTEEGFFRNPEDCTKYYRCIDEGDGTFTREDFSCAEDEVFDEEMRYCNRKDLAPPCDGSTQEQTTSSQTQSTTEKSTAESTTDAGAKGECSEPGFYRCPEDCNKFYRCVDENGDGQNLVRYDFKCPEGLIFDENNKKCDWPSSELTCDTETSTSTTSSQSTTSSSGTSSSNECTEEGFFRNPEDCSKYYRCIDEGDGTLTREDFTCAEDEVFDEEMRYCNRKDLAPPCDTSSTSGSTASESSASTEGPGSTSSDAGTTSSDAGTTSSDSGTSSSDSGSSGSGECQEEGFHRDPNDCSKFYRCVDFKGDGQSFTRYDFDCPEGLVFDETNSVCNWPSSVPACESTGGSDRSTSGSTDSSSSDSGTSTSDQDSSSMTSTPASSSTQDISEGSSSTPSDGESSSSSSTGSDSATSDSSSTSSSSSQTSGDNKSSSDIECTEEGFFRHPDDCSKFYRCVDFKGTGESFVRYDFDCPEGLVFDEVNSVCNWPTMSPGCESGSRGSGGSQSTTSGDGSSSTSGESGDSETTSTGSAMTTGSTSSTRATGDQTTSRTTTTSSTSSSADDFKCEDEGFFKHPDDCKKYYECKRDEDTGELVRIDCECPSGQVFDSEGWYCNAEELSPPCDKGSSSFKCKDEGFFRDPEDCTKYYQCNRTGPGDNDFSSEKFQCPDGNVFDEEGRYCNAPELSQPCDDSSTSSSTTSGDSSSSSSDSSSSGDSSSSSTTGTSSGQGGECTQEGFFRNPDDCTKYYQCVRNEEQGTFERNDFECSDGRIFDEGPSYCNDPELSQEPCESDGSTSSQQTARTDSTSTAQQTSSSDSSGTASSGNRKAGGDPECTQAGFFRHPDDCNKFYRCVDFSGSGESFVRYDFDCPEGLHFDEVNSVCNWPTMTPRCESGSRFLR